MKLKKVYGMNQMNHYYNDAFRDVADTLLFRVSFDINLKGEQTHLSSVASVPIRLMTLLLLNQVKAIIIFFKLLITICEI